MVRKFENEIDKRSRQENSLKKINTLEMNRKLQYTEHNLKSRAHIIPNLRLVLALLLSIMYFVCTEIGQHTAKWKFNELCNN